MEKRCFNLYYILCTQLLNTYLNNLMQCKLLFFSKVSDGSVEVTLFLWAWLFCLWIMFGVLQHLVCIGFEAIAKACVPGFSCDNYLKWLTSSNEINGNLEAYCSIETKRGTRGRDFTLCVCHCVLITSGHASRSCIGHQLSPSLPLSLSLPPSLPHCPPPSLHLF